MSFRRPEKFVNRLETATRLDQNGLRGIERVNAGSTAVRFLNLQRDLQRDLKQTKELIGRLHMQMQTSVPASGSDSTLLEWIEEKIRGVQGITPQHVTAKIFALKEVEFIRDMFIKKKQDLKMDTISEKDIYCNTYEHGIQIGFQHYNHDVEGNVNETIFVKAKPPAMAAVWLNQAYNGDMILKYKWDKHNQAKAEERRKAPRYYFL